MAYVSLAEVKTYLGIQTNSDDSLLESLILNAQSFVEEETSKRFETATDATRYFTYREDTGTYRHRHDSRQRRTLWLDYDLAQAPTSIINGDGTAVSLSDVILLPLNEPPYRQIRIKESASIAWAEGAIAVTGRWAYSVTPPPRIKQATIRLAGFFYRQKDAQTYDLTGFGELGTVQMRHNIPQDIVHLLAPYKERFV